MDELIKSPIWRLYFHCDGASEQLNIGIKGSRPATRIVLRIGTQESKYDDMEYNVIVLSSSGCRDGFSLFNIAEEQLLAVCTAQTIDLSTDLDLPQSAKFDELPMFASRFYNAAFNRMKFIYSTRVNMLTDKVY